jgi:threonine/homoserine/homoserine lactone efflux protein
VLLNLLNPKAALFFVAILPNYVPAGRAVMQQTLTLSIAYVLVATFVHLGLALFAAHAHRWFEEGSRARIVRRVCALSIAGVAMWFLANTAA